MHHFSLFPIIFFLVFPISPSIVSCIPFFAFLLLETNGALAATIFDVQEEREGLA